MKKKKIDISEKLDILSSIWILSCNDENPQITYEGIKYRLGLPDNFDVKALVHSRSELFRKHTTQMLLNSWKVDMLNNKRLPSWIKDVEDKEQRKQIINALTIEDIFRSQFRAEANSPRSKIEIINWGLQHINRLRKAELDVKHEKMRIFSSIWIPILSTIVAIVAVVSSFYVQFTNNKNQAFLKNYEIEFRPKQLGYSEFMNAATQSYFYAVHNNKLQMVQYLDRIENSYYSLEPFLKDSDRDKIWEQYQQYSGLCYSIIESDLPKDLKKSADSFIW
jgi:hypothetical protein